MPRWDYDKPHEIVTPNWVELAIKKNVYTQDHHVVYIYYDNMCICQILLF